LANMDDIRIKLEHGCALQKSDGGFRMVEWMISVGTLYKKCLIAVRLFEQTGDCKLWCLLTDISMIVCVLRSKTAQTIRDG
jgi:hypothetical protein